VAGREVKPFLKWVGSKRYLVPEILPRLPAQINTYYEPFLGGGAVFFALAAEGRFKKAVLNDANADLVHTYKTISRSVDDLIINLKLHEQLHSEAHYYETRAYDFSKQITLRAHVARAARVIYLNRTCFNGLYRVNKSGQFNVPFGKYANPKICDEENLRAVASVIRSTQANLMTGDFVKSVRTAKQGDSVYFDPPYVPVSKTSSFVSFSKDGFGEEDQTRLRDCFAALDAKGVHVLLSNSDTELVRELYRGFRIDRVQAPRRVNSKGDKRGNVTELIISGKGRS